MYNVVINQTGAGDYFLKGTTWTSSKDRAFIFETIEAAEYAIGKAMVFMKKSSRKFIAVKGV